MLQQWLIGISSFHHHNIEIEILFKVRSLLKGSVWFYSNERVEQSNRFIRRLAAELGEPDETPIKWSQCKAPLVTSSAVQTRVNPLPLSLPPPPPPLWWVNYWDGFHAFGAYQGPSRRLQCEKSHRSCGRISCVWTFEALVFDMTSAVGSSTV